MKTKLPNLEYKGYKGVFRFISKKEGFEARIFSSSNLREPLEDIYFRGRSKKYLRKRFENYVDEIIAEKFLSKNNAEWLRANDYLSVCYVYNILPDEFRKRIENNEFDKILLESVKGWDYEVPLYYITKAYDILLKDFLIREWEQALKASESPNCRQKCLGCGAARYGVGVCTEPKTEGE